MVCWSSNSWTAWAPDVWTDPQPNGSWYDIHGYHLWCFNPWVAPSQRWSPTLWYLMISVGSAIHGHALPHPDAHCSHKCERMIHPVRGQHLLPTWAVVSNGLDQAEPLLVADVASAPYVFSLLKLQHCIVQPPITKHWGPIRCEHSDSRSCLFQCLCSQVAMNTTIAAASGGISVFMIKYVIKKKYATWMKTWNRWNSLLEQLQVFYSCCFFGWHDAPALLLPLKIIEAKGHVHEQGRTCFGHRKAMVKPCTVNDGQHMATTNHDRCNTGTCLLLFGGCLPANTIRLAFTDYACTERSSQHQSTNLWSHSSGHCWHVQWHFGWLGVHHCRMLLGSVFIGMATMLVVHDVWMVIWVFLKVGAPLSNINHLQQ